jgi:hypothetical protein
MRLPATLCGKTEPSWKIITRRRTCKKLEAVKAAEADRDEWAEEVSVQEASASALRAEPACPIKEGLHATKKHALNAGQL